MKLRIVFDILLFNLFSDYKKFVILWNYQQLLEERFTEKLGVSYRDFLYAHAQPPPLSYLPLGWYIYHNSWTTQTS